MSITYDMFVKSFGIQPMLVSVAKDLVANGFINKILAGCQDIQSRQVLDTIFLIVNRGQILALSEKQN